MSEQTSRRSLVKGIAAGGLALPLLAACGSASGASGGGGSAGSGSGASAKVPSGGIPESEIPVKGGKIFGGANVAVSQPTAGSFKAFSNICTHMGCPITELQGTTMVCGCHGSQFDILDGSVIQGPATQPLPAKKVTVTGGKITVA